MNVRGIGISDIGMERARNEDCMLVDDSLRLYVVADGLGGHRAGDMASAIAVDAVQRFVAARRKLLDRFRQGWGGEEELSRLAVRAISHACRVVHEHATGNIEWDGMGCTLTVLIVGHRKAGIAHVGDSRLYLDRKGRVRQMTSDHNYAHELVRLGLVASEDVASVHGGNRLTRAVGLEPTVAVDELLIDLRPGDRFILCSDGLSSYLANPNELDELLAETRFEHLAHHLVCFANESGGHDNVTVVLVEIEAAASDVVEVTTADITPVINRFREEHTPPSWTL